MVVRHALKVFVDLFLVFHIVNKQIPSPLGFLFRAHVFFYGKCRHHLWWLRIPDPKNWKNPTGDDCILGGG